MKKTESTAIVLTAHNIHKEFVLPQHKRTSVKQAFVNIVNRNGKTIQKVLDGVDFEVERGDFLGIVGRNGSGKSTLLKILAGVYAPTVGEVAVHGGLTPFIELGVGFNPELSGRDNVFLNGALLGFSRAEMEAMYDEIVEFAELGPFMDQKLKNYSSGMQVRLAFSIAIKAHSDVLIFDEVLAVGDEAFQRKCLDVFERYKAEGQTVILVTHDMETVRKFCNKALLISEGTLRMQGDPQRVADEYSRLNQEQIDKELALLNRQGDIRVISCDFETGKPKTSFETGEDMLLKLGWQQNDSIDAIVVNIFKTSGEHVTSFKSVKDGQEPIGSRTKATIRINAKFAPGTYHFLISLRDKDDKEVSTAYDASRFTVIRNWERAGTAWSGLVPVEHEWLEIHES